MFNTLMCQALAISQKKIFTNIHKTRWLFKSWNKIISLWCLFLHLQWPCYHDHDRCGSGACISRDTGYWVRDRKIHLDGMRAHTFTHTWTPRGNLVSPICLPACFDSGSKLTSSEKTHTYSWRACKTPHGHQTLTRAQDWSKDFLLLSLL